MLTPGRTTVILLSALLSVLIVQLACTPCNVRSIDPPDERPVVVHVDCE